MLVPTFFVRENNRLGEEITAGNSKLTTRDGKERYLRFIASPRL